MTELDNFSVRLASADDYEEILEMSEGIYGGRDYLPNVYFQWLQEPNRSVFVALLGRKLVGLCSIAIIDGGKTFFNQALRVHLNYRGLGLSSRLLSLICEYVSLKHPSATRERYMINISNTVAMAILSKRGDKILLKIPVLSYDISREALKAETLDEITGCLTVRVKPCSKQEFNDVLMERQVPDRLFPKDVVIFDWVSFLAIPANTSYILQDGVQVFTEQRGDTAQGRDFPESISFGGCRQGNDHLWATTIYTANPVMFKAHLAYQVKTACHVFHGKDVVTFELTCGEQFAGIVENWMSEKQKVGNIKKWTAVLAEHIHNSTLADKTG